MLRAPGPFEQGVPVLLQRVEFVALRDRPANSYGAAGSMSGTKPVLGPVKTRSDALADVGYRKTKTLIAGRDHAAPDLAERALATGIRRDGM